MFARSLLLPKKFQAKLNNPAIGCASKSTKGSRCDSCPDSREINLVECIEKLGPKLQLIGLPEGEVFDNREVSAVEGRPADQAPSCIPIDPSRNLFGRHKGGRIEETLDHSASTGMVNGDLVPSYPGNQFGMLGSKRTIQSHVVTHKKGERQTALNGMNSSQRPLAQQAIRRGIGEFNGRRPQPGSHKSVTPIPVGTPSFVSQVKGIGHGGPQVVRGAAVYRFRKAVRPQDRETF